MRRLAAADSWNVHAFRQPARKRVDAERPEPANGGRFWLEDAKRWGTTPAERDLYEWNARNIITLWGTKCTEGQNDDLNFYAHKQWQGMFAGYYKPRWEAFFAELDGALAEGRAFDRAPYAARMCAWEQAWSRGHETYPTEPRGDALDLARTLVAKYRPALDGIGG